MIMAVAKLGAIVTGLAGSIGGTQFRRGHNALVVSNKSRGLSRSKALDNEGLIYMNHLINAWTGLGQVDRDAWDIAATNYQFPDKFGTLKYLTGRQLFIKLNSNVSRTIANLLDPDLLESGVPDVGFSSVTLEFDGADNAFTTVTGEATDDFYLVVRFYKVPNYVAKPVFNKRKRQFEQTVSGAFPGPFLPTFQSVTSSTFPGISVNSKYWFIVQAFNLFGFPAIPQAFQVTPTMAP